MAFWGPLSLQTPDDYVAQTPGYEQRRQQAPVYQPQQLDMGQDMGGLGVTQQGLSPQDVNTATLAEQGPAMAGGGWGGVLGMVKGGDKKNPSFDTLAGAPNAMEAWKRLWPEWGGTGAR